MAAVCLAFLWLLHNKVNRARRPLFYIATPICNVVFGNFCRPERQVFSRLTRLTINSSLIDRNTVNITSPC